MPKIKLCIVLIGFLCLTFIPKISEAAALSIKICNKGSINIFVYRAHKDVWNYSTVEGGWSLETHECKYFDKKGFFGWYYFMFVKGIDKNSDGQLDALANLNLGTPSRSWRIAPQKFCILSYSNNFSNKKKWPNKSCKEKDWELATFPYFISEIESGFESANTGSYTYELDIYPKNNSEVIEYLFQREKEQDTSPQISDTQRQYNQILGQAQKGDTEAQYKLGKMYYYGKGVGVNKYKALQWFSKASEEGDVNSQYFFAYMLETGQGGEKNILEAIKWYERAAQSGHIDAQFNLGFLFMNQKTKSTDSLAVKWFSEAIASDHAEAQYHLGILYGKGRGVKKNIEKAFELCKLSAENGYGRAQYWLGVLYEKGMSVSASDTIASKWYQKASDSGHASAKYKLAMKYEKGEGVSKNRALAVKLYIESAKLGVLDAQLWLAEDFAIKGGIFNDIVAKRWYLLAAQQGNSIAQYNLGLFNFKGRAYSSKKSRYNYLEAEKWFVMAAAQGHIDAQFHLGLLFEGRYLGQKNVAKATEWFKKAANKGHPGAQAKLQKMYPFGPPGN